MNDAARLFERALEWLRENYDQFLFRREEDLVTVIWARMVKLAKAEGLPLVVDYEQNFHLPEPGPKPIRYQADIAAYDADGRAILCVEIKYEPSRCRPDIAKREPKHDSLRPFFPGHGRKGHTADIEKVRAYVDSCKVEIAYAVLVDEDSHHFPNRQKLPGPQGTTWTEWGARTPDGYKTAIMVYRYPLQP